MSISLLFWVIMIIWLIFGFYQGRTGPNWPMIGNSLVLFILLALLGWRVFGPAIHN